MTQAFNLSQLANNLNTSGQLDATDGLTGSVPVANGGTGASTLTANNVLLGNGTSALQTVAPGSSGNILTSNGTTWASTAPSGGGAQQFSLATYTTAYNSKGTPLVKNSNGNFTWTAPAGVTSVKLTAIGGGTGINNYGGFNGAGGLGIGIYTVTPGTAYSVLVGAAGAGFDGTGGPAPGGGTSSFGSLLSATGGSGGYGGGSNGSAPNGNLRNTNVTVWQPLGGPQPTADETGCRGCTINWVPDTNNGTPGATNPNHGYSISGVLYIEYIG